MTEADNSTHCIDEELQDHVARAFNFDEPPATFEAFWEKMIGTFAEALDRSVTLDDLCTTDESPHWASVNGETRYYQCVTDAFLLGTYVNDPVTVRTVTPESETELVVEFDANGVGAVPEDAVLSFGVERSVEAPDGPVTPETMYGRFCPYSNVFASRDEYEEWAASNPEIVSDVQPLDESLDLQATLLRDADSISDRTASQERSSGSCSC